MADEHAVEPPPGTPGQRALGAMESAVRRARAASGAPPTPAETDTELRPAERPPSPTRRLDTPAPPTAVRAGGAALPPIDADQDTAIVAPPGRVRPRSGGDVRILDGPPLADAPRREDTLELPETQPRRTGATNRWLFVAVAVVAALVIAAGIALIVSLGRGPQPATRTAAHQTPAGAPPNHSPTTIPSGTGKQRTTSTTIPSTSAPSTSSPSSTTTPVAVTPGGPPSIATLSPASGKAGQTITVSGANFLSSSGQIVATFNGQVAPTSCPAQNTCTLTVPASTSTSAQVVITTSGGTSNVVTFTYT